MFIVTKDCHTAGKSQNDPVMMRSMAPDALFMYQQFKLDIKALRPKEGQSNSINFMFECTNQVNCKICKLNQGLIDLKIDKLAKQME